MNSTEVLRKSPEDLSPQVVEMHRTVKALNTSVLVCIESILLMLVQVTRDLSVRESPGPAAKLPARA